MPCPGARCLRGPAVGLRLPLRLRLRVQLQLRPQSLQLALLPRLSLSRPNGFTPMSPMNPANPTKPMNPIASALARSEHLRLPC